MREAARVIKNGGAVVYPTETVYGLAADATSDEAVRKVFAIKSRDTKNPISIAVNSHEMLKKFAELSRPPEKLAKKLLPGPVTLILRAKAGVSKLLTTDGKIGIRMPDHPVSRGLVEASGGPITSTSANVSGHPPPTTAREALEQVGNRVELALDAGRCRFGKPSTVVDLTADPPRILREGAMKRAEIFKFLEG